MLKLSMIAVLAVIYAVSTGVTTSALARGHGGGGHGGGFHGGGGHHFGGGGHYHGGHPHGHHDDWHHDWHHIHPGLVIAAAVAIGTVINHPPHACVTEVVYGVQYCHDSNHWYRINGTTYVVVTRPSVPDHNSVEQRIKELESLANKGIISKQEYQARRKAILDGI